MEEFRPAPARLSKAGCLRGSLAHDRAPLGESLAPAVERESDVRQVGVRLFFQIPGEACRRRIQSGFGLGGDGEQLKSPGRSVRFRPGSFLQDHVRIGAADPERRYTCAGRLRSIRPVAQLGIHEERAALEIDQRVRHGEVQAGRYLAMLESQNSLDEPRRSRRCIQMTDVRLHRSDRAVAATLGALRGRPR